MGEVQAKRETVLITKHGKPVAKLVPTDKNSDDIFNFLVGRAPSREISMRERVATDSLSPI